MALEVGKIEFIIPTDYEKEILNRLDHSYLKISEMSNEDREFLTALILRYNPCKLMEIGVSGGGSSVVLLNAIKENHNAKLFSIDLRSYWYLDPRKKAGFVVDNYPDLKNKWRLFTNALALQFIDEIGDNIDFCLIDTAHSNPGEIFDILTILPYLKDDAIVVFHDIKLHTRYMGRKPYITNDLIMSALYGTKLLQGNYMGKLFPNIGGIKIERETKQRVFEIFNLLTLKWAYLPNKEQQELILRHFEKFYDQYYIDYIKMVFEYQKKVLLSDSNYQFRNIIKRIVGEKNIRKIRRIKSG